MILPKKGRLAANGHQASRGIEKFIIKSVRLLNRQDYIPEGTKSILKQGGEEIVLAFSSYGQFTSFRDIAYY